MLVLASAIIGLLVPYLTGRAIDAIAPGQGKVRMDVLLAIALFMGSVFLADTCFNVIQGYMMSGISQRIVQGLRTALFGKMQKLPLSFFDTRSHGDLLSRLTNDIDNVSQAISQSTAQLFSSAAVIAGSLVMMLIMSPLLTLAALITVPMVLFLSNFIASKTGRLFKEQQAILGKLNGHIEESISGIGVVKAFGREEITVSDFDILNQKLCMVGIRAQIWSGYIMPLMNVINNIGFTAVITAGALLVLQNIVTLGTIASFIGYSRQFGRPLNDIASIFNMLQTAIAGAERVFEILDEKEEEVDPVHKIDLVNPHGHIEFRNVSFGYRQDVMVLKNISFEAAQGSRIAFVGPTGAGKTTIVNLLTRFYEVSSGSILIDGKDIRQYSRKSLRNCFGTVLQDTYLFTGTISENIRYGKLDASEEDIEQASKLSYAHGFISHLPEGYNTILTESGSNLSHGQRQLIAIARAALAGASILILDEATSSVDTLTEQHIQQALQTLMKGRTSFIIAHRLRTIRDADRILVIENGVIEESGSHLALLRKKGLYYRFYHPKALSGNRS
jgi:ATP-binding cassette subfamily B protein